VRLTKYGHACVRLDTDSGAVVIDPGSYTRDADLGGITDLLLTHEHPDHVDPALVVPAARAGARVRAPAEVAQALTDEHGVDVEAVAPGDTVEVAGLRAHVVGGEHAEIYDGLPGCANVGYLLHGVYHPGDSLHVPEQAVETLLVPVSGPWLKLAEVLDFVRALRPERAFPVHDALLSEAGAAGVDRWVERKGSTDYRRLASGESVGL
jgi:L-ascorbate metabolism protein UlaG (beta-lactamase superfamily)